MPLILDAEAAKAKGTSASVINSSLVCGDRLCSEIDAMPLPGSDRDEHGCIGSAGYTWSEEKQECVRPWEETEPIEESIDPIIADTPLSLLFVQTAHSGTLLEEDGKLVLTLNDVSPITVFFSDRPNRITGHDSTQEFVDKWSAGDDSFADNPPNAAIDILTGDEAGDILIIELMNPVYDSDARTLQYDVLILEKPSLGLAHYGDRADDSIPKSFGTVTLFIDNAEDKDCSPGPQKDLRGCDYSNAELGNATFTASVLMGVDFSGANLSAADFRGAILNGANLSGATLTGTNFSPAYNCLSVFHNGILMNPCGDVKITGELERGASLARANLSDVDLSSADLYNTDLTYVTGLDDKQKQIARDRGALNVPE